MVALTTNSQEKELLINFNTYGTHKNKLRRFRQSKLEASRIGLVSDFFFGLRRTSDK
jgi:hypothetical protein